MKWEGGHQPKRSPPSLNVAVFGSVWFNFDSYRYKIILSSPILVCLYSYRINLAKISFTIYFLDLILPDKNLLPNNTSILLFFLTNSYIS